MTAMHEINRESWDEWAAIHLRDATGFYNIAGFKAGDDTLLPIEAAEIGDVAGLRTAHLQCHFGLDSMSLARRGAEVTGLDFSPVAIEGARRLAAETGSATTFVQANVYDARRELQGEFDLVYVTWGAINWLPDIARWGRVVGSLLRPGGRLYLAETHPHAFNLSEEQGAYRVAFDWRNAPDAPTVYQSQGSYTGDETPLVHGRFHEWAHPLSAIFAALISGGLQLDRFNEHETLPYRLFPSLVEEERQSFRLPDGVPRFPLSFSLWASKT
ncbi:hypothetical protein LMIY3S_05165 [Labrys miyagiensis]